MRHAFFITAVLAACAGPSLSRTEGPEAPAVPPLANAIELPADWLRNATPDVGAGFVLDRDAAGVSVARWVFWEWTGLIEHRTPMPLLRGGAQPRTSGEFDYFRLACVLGDFDGDGSDELCVNDGYGYVALGNERAWRRVNPAAPRPELAGRWLSGRAFDWNGDGRADVAYASGRDVLVLTDVARSTANAGLVSLTAEDVADATDLVGTAADWDRDGDPDLLLAIPERGLVWLRNDGARDEPRFSPPIPLGPAAPLEVVTMLLAHDADGDGWPDLFVGSVTRTAGAGDSTIRERRADLTGPEAADLAQLQLELRSLEQRQARVAAGLEPAAPGQMFGSSFRSTDQWKLDNLRKAIDRLQWRTVAVMQNAMRCHFRRA